MRHHTDTPKIQAHQPEHHMDDLTFAQQANEDALFLLKHIDGQRIDIEAIRKRVTMRHYQMVARLAAVAKTAEKQ
jgi:hypothetical protein